MAYIYKTILRYCPKYIHNDGTINYDNSLEYELISESDKKAETYLSVNFTDIFNPPVQWKKALFLYFNTFAKICQPNFIFAYLKTS